MAEVFVKFTIFGVSMFLMFFLSKYLVESLTHFSRKLKVSEFMVGSIVLAIGTSLPEIIDSLVASSIGLGELVVGMVVGSNLSNLLLILPTAVLVKPIVQIGKGILKESYVLLIVTLVFGIISIDGSISRLEGLILLGFFAAYHWFLHKEDAHVGSLVYMREIQADIVLTPIAIFTILLCGWLVVNTGASLAIEYNIPLSLFGLIVIAIATSLPELSSSIVSARKGHSKMTLGNIFGSNATNILLAAGLAAVFNPLVFSGFNNITFSVILLLLASSGFTVLIHKTRRAGRRLGSSMLIVYVFYLAGISIFGGVI